MKSLPVRAIVGFLLLFVGLSIVSGQMMQTYAQFAYSHTTGSRQLGSSQWYLNGNAYATCFPSDDNTVQCSGNLDQDPNGCMLLVVPVQTWVNDPGSVVTAAIQYYTLHNLPTSYPRLGAWVTVTGQLYRGYNTAPNGEACPGNYINVTSIS